MGVVIHAYRPLERLPEDEQELAGMYRALLAGQRGLLLLDDARDADQVQPLLPPHGWLCLVTSRTHFALPGLVPCDLDTLPAADARTLIGRIAPRLSDAEADDLARLRGCLPLALRMTASALAERPDLPALCHCGAPPPAPCGRTLSQRERAG